MMLGAVVVVVRMFLVVHFAARSASRLSSAE
jgi:hypothetical protein